MRLPFRIEHYLIVILFPPYWGGHDPFNFPPKLFCPPQPIFVSPPLFRISQIWGGGAKICKNHVPPNFGGDSSYFSIFFCFPPSLGGDITSPKRCFPPNAFVSPPNRLSPPKIFCLGGGNISIFGEILEGKFVNFPPNCGECPPQSYPPCFENGPLLDALFFACPPLLGGKEQLCCTAVGKTWFFQYRIFWKSSLFFAHHRLFVTQTEVLRYSLPLKLYERSPFPNTLE